MNKLLKISKDGCVPCQILSNYLNDKGIVCEELNISTNEDLIQTYNITGVPVLILLNEDDQEIKRVDGFNPQETDELLEKM